MTTIRMRRFRGTYVSPRTYRRLVVQRFTTTWSTRIDEHREAIMASALVAYGLTLVSIASMLIWH